MVMQGGGHWEKNWRIAEGTSVSTPDEIAGAAAQEASRAEREVELATLPWYNVEHTTPRRSGYSGFDDAQAICDRINRRVCESIGSAGGKAREAMQVEIESLKKDMVGIYGIHIVEYQP